MTRLVHWVVVSFLYMQLEWQKQVESSSQTISVLQDRLEASRTQLQQQDSIVEQLQADLQVSVGEIQFWKEQQVQEADKFKQVYTLICNHTPALSQSVLPFSSAGIIKSCRKRMTHWRCVPASVVCTPPFSLPPLCT